MEHMPLAMYGHAAIRLEADVALVCGGASGGEAQKICYQFSATTETWKQTHDLNTPRTRFGMARWNDGG
jgi:hypothetical protein